MSSEFSIASPILQSGHRTGLTCRTTGITAKVVERMEEALKQDVLKEIRAGQGRLLLHDEVETKPGTYEIIPIWEAVDESDVMTPKELYSAVTDEAFKVDYQRVAVVCHLHRYPSAQLICADGRAGAVAGYIAGYCQAGSHGS